MNLLPDPNATNKRKRGSDVQSDDDEVIQDEGLEEDLDDDLNEKDSDEDREEDYVAPQKSSTGPRKPKTASTSATAVNGRAAPRKPRGGGLANGPTKRRPRKKAGEGDVDPKALAQEASIADDNVLFSTRSLFISRKAQIH